MAFTTITTPISVDLQKPNVCEVVYAKQHDRLTRKVAVSVYNNGTAYSIPTSSVKYIVRALKPDGTICIYEKDENNTNAVSISGNVATITLAQQALACPGNVKMELCVTNTSQTESITSFSFELKVEASALDGPSSTNYANPVIPTTYVESASVSGNSLILVPHNGNQITFTPQGGGGSVTPDLVVTATYNYDNKDTDSGITTPYIYSYSLSQSLYNTIISKLQNGEKPLILVDATYHDGSLFFKCVEEADVFYTDSSTKRLIIVWDRHYVSYNSSMVITSVDTKTFGCRLSY